MNELIHSNGQNAVADVLDRFKCSRNPDIEEFLKQHAIVSEKGNRCRTFVILVPSERNTEGAVGAFFSIAIGMMRISPDVSRTKAKRLAGIFYDKDDRCQITPCYLVGQIGKDDDLGEDISGDRLLGLAMQAIMMAWEQVGGRFVRIDCEDAPGLISFYERNGFERLQVNERTKLVEMVRFL